MSAAERYRKGSILYGDKLLAEEKPCDAAVQYQNALNLSVDETTQSKFNDATNKCSPPTEEAHEPTAENTINPATETPPSDPVVPPVDPVVPTN
jgi:hypothetical protein